MCLVPYIDLPFYFLKCYILWLSSARVYPFSYQRTIRLFQFRLSPVFCDWKQSVSERELAFPGSNSYNSLKKIVK